MLVSIEDLSATESAEIELTDGGADATGLTPEAELIAKADAEQLKCAIAALPLVFRETLVLRDVQGLNYREIADITGVPIGTVMSRLARARRHLFKAIGAKKQ